MAEPFATLVDLQLHWPQLAEEDEEVAEQKLDEAAIIIRGNFPDIDERIAKGTIDAGSAKLVSVGMVKRAMEETTSPPGVDSATGQTGPFMSTLRFTHPDDNLYLTKADKRLLSPRRRAFSIYPGGVGR